MTHPRSPLDYSGEKMAQSKATWARLHASLAALPERGSTPAQSPAAQEFRARFDAALADDLNTPIALAAAFDALALWRREGEADASLVYEVRAALEVLGFTFEASASRLENDALAPQLIELLIRVRDEARERRDFKTSDVIRDELKNLEVILEDAPDGTRWKLAN
jgi:cysteinyl-tRNA synthetase